jgi:hypothetical protein
LLTCRRRNTWYAAFGWRSVSDGQQTVITLEKDSQHMVFGSQLSPTTQSVNAASAGNNHDSHVYQAHAHAARQTSPSAAPDDKQLSMRPAATYKTDVFKQSQLKPVPRNSAKHGSLGAQPLQQTAMAQCPAARAEKKQLPHVPDDIGLAVLTQIETCLNPFTLMALMNVEGKDHIPPFLTRVAWDNAFWKRFSRISLSGPKTNHAQAFLIRYNAMSTLHRAILENIWSGQVSAIQILNLQPETRDNFDIAMAAVSLHGWTLSFVCCELQGDKDIVTAAVLRHGWALEYASEDLQGDKDIVMAAVCQDGGALEYASDALRADPSIVLAAVRQDGRALHFAAEALRGERGIVMAAVNQCGEALRFVANALENDRDIVIAAVKQCGIALRHADITLRSERAIVLAAVCQDGAALEFATDELQDDQKIVMTAVSQDGAALKYAADELRGNRDIVMAAVSKNGLALADASDELRAVRQIVMAAVRQDGMAIQYAPYELQIDLELNAIANRRNPLRVAEFLASLR